MTVLISKVETLNDNLIKSLSTILISLSENIFSLMDSLLSLGIAEKSDLVRFEDKIPGPMDFVVNPSERKDVLITRILAMGRAGAIHLNELQLIVDNIKVYQHYISYMSKVLKYIQPDILNINSNFKEKAQIPFRIVVQVVQKLQSFFSTNSKDCNLFSCTIELYKLYQRTSPVLAPFIAKFDRQIKNFVRQIKNEDGDVAEIDSVQVETLKAKIQARYSKELNSMFMEIIKIKEIETTSIKAKLLRDFLLDLIFSEDELENEVYARLHMKTEQQLKQEEYHKKIYDICQQIGRYHTKISEMYSYTVDAIKEIKNHEGFMQKLIRTINDFIGNPISGIYGKQNGKVTVINFKPALNQLNELLKLLKKCSKDITPQTSIMEIEILLNQIFENVIECLEELYQYLYEVTYKDFKPDTEIRREIVYAEEKVFHIIKEEFLLLYENYMPYRKEEPTLGAIHSMA